MTTEKKIYEISKRENHYHIWPIREDDPQYGVMVGRGIQYRVNCGTFKRGYSCKCRKTVKIIKHNCKKLDCPECFDGAVMQRAGKMFGYMLGIQKTKIKRLNHYAINIQVIPTDRREFKILRDYVNKILLYFHYYRMDRKKRELYVSPHFHVVTDSRIKMKSNMFHDDVFGFTYKLLRTITTFDIKSYKMTKYKSDGTTEDFNEKEGCVDVMLNMLAYPLSHAQILPYSKAYYYCGQITKKKKVNTTKIEDVPRCDSCESKIYAIDEFKIVDSHHSKKVKFKLSLVRDLVQELELYGDLLENIVVPDKIEVISIDKTDWITYTTKIYELRDKKKPVKKTIVGWFSEYETPSMNYSIHRYI